MRALALLLAVSCVVPPDDGKCRQLDPEQFAMLERHVEAELFDAGRSRVVYCSASDAGWSQCFAVSIEAKP